MTNSDIFFEKFILGCEAWGNKTKGIIVNIKKKRKTNKDIDYNNSYAN